jgi:hypothetical protein
MPLTPEEIIPFRGANMAEMETTYLLDPVDKEYACWTANYRVARKWAKLGWPVEVSGTVNGVPRSWDCTVPAKAITLRKQSAYSKTPVPLTPERQAALTRGRAARDAARSADTDAGKS